jgi:hypothetical protein
MEDVGIFYGHLVYLMAIWYFCGNVGAFYGYLVYFTRCGMFYQDKSGNPVLDRAFRGGENRKIRLMSSI